MLESNSTQQHSCDVIIRNLSMKYYVDNYYLQHYANNFQNLEPDTLDWIDSFEENSVFCDVGASGGYFSLYAAIKKNCTIFAFEPEAQNFAILEKNHYLNHTSFFNPFMTFNLALGNKKKISELYIFRYEAGSAMKVLDNPVKRCENESFQPAHIQYVREEKLDDFISEYELPTPNYVKIDVDGSESKVIDGAKVLLQNNDVRSVLIEIEHKNNYENILDDIKNLGFSIKEKSQVEDFKGLYNYLFVR